MLDDEVQRIGRGWQDAVLNVDCARGICDAVACEEPGCIRTCREGLDRWWRVVERVVGGVCRRSCLCRQVAQVFRASSIGPTRERVVPAVVRCSRWGDHLHAAALEELLRERARPGPSAGRDNEARRVGLHGDVGQPREDIDRPNGRHPSRVGHGQGQGDIGIELVIRRHERSGLANRKGLEGVGMAQRAVDRIAVLDDCAPNICARGQHLLIVDGDPCVVDSVANLPAGPVSRGRQGLDDRRSITRVDGTGRRSGEVQAVFDAQLDCHVF